MYQRRVQFIAAFYILLILILIGRLFQLQVIHGAHYRERTENKILDLRVVPSWRGNIVDRQGEFLAMDELSWDVGLVFQEFDEARTSIRQLHKLLLLPRKLLKEPPENFSLHRYWQALDSATQGQVVALIQAQLNLDMQSSLQLLQAEHLQWKKLRRDIIQEQQQGLIYNLSDLLQAHPDDILKRIEDKRAQLQDLVDRKWETTAVFRKPQAILTQISVEQAQTIELHLDQYPGVSVLSSLRRGYPYGERFSHILGYVNMISAEEYARRKNEMHALEGFERRKVQVDDLLGRAGLEKQFEHVLAGLDGLALVERNARGIIQKTIAERPPESGGTLQLTIDARLQAACYESFRRRNFRGSVVAVDVHTGEVLVLVTYPSYDNNWFIRPTSNVDLRKLFEDTPENKKRQPNVNRAISAIYPPGSTVKIPMSLAGLESGTISPAHMTSCNYGATSRYGSKTCNSVHHSVGLLTAIQKSCNMFYYELGINIGIDRMSDVFHDYGFGESTGIELPAEMRGLIGTPEWKRNRFNQTWFKSETEDVSIGQGFFQVSPLQLARFYAAVANGGRLYDSRLIHKVNGKVQMSSFKELSFQSKHLNIVRRGMRMVCQPGGTAYGSGVERYDAAGKTGTAQVYNQEPHALFAGYAPFDRPQIAFAVVVENGGHGGDTAAPIAAELLKAWTELQGLERDAVNTPQPEDEEE